MKTASFSTLLHAFFHEWLVQQRNVSHHTILSYRDTWRLFLRFVSQRQTRPVATLSLPELGASEVLAFLNHIESERHVSIGTRNCRLAALHSFFAFVGQREPLAVSQCSEILRIPMKRSVRPAMCY